MKNVAEMIVFDKMAEIELVEKHVETLGRRFYGDKQG